MKEITICVSPLVKRIFLSRYGAPEPIKVHRSDIVYHLLQGDPVRVNPHRYQQLSKTLTKSIRLRVSPPIYKRLSGKNRQVHVGYFLHKIYQEELLTFTEAQNMAGVPAQLAMKSYLDRHGVTEDDYVLASAYTAWLRRKAFRRKQIQKKSGLFLQRSVLPVEIKTDTCNPMVYDPRIILQEVNKYFQSGFVNLLCHDIRIKGQGRDFTYYYDPVLHRKFVHERRVLAYVLHLKSKLSCEEMATIISLPARSLRRYVSAIRFQYEHYEDIKTQVDTIISRLSGAN